MRVTAAGDAEAAVVCEGEPLTVAPSGGEGVAPEEGEKPKEAEGRGESEGKGEAEEDSGAEAEKTPVVEGGAREAVTNAL